MVLGRVRKTDVTTNATGEAKQPTMRRSKIAELEEKRRTLESRRSRKTDTRRKILVGAIVLARVERGGFPEAELRR